MRLLTAELSVEKLILTAIFTWCGTVEFYELHTSRGLHRINSGSNIHLVRYCGDLGSPCGLLTASIRGKINFDSNIHLVRYCGVLRTPYEQRLHRN